jgi:hypothetical protein
MITTIILILLSVLLLISIYVNWNLYRKVGILEKYSTDFLTELTTLKEKISLANKIMNDADTKGGFSSDDEIGSVFKLIKGCIEYLDGDNTEIEDYGK